MYEYITMYSPIARSVVLRRRNWTILELLGNAFIHIAARSRLPLQWRNRAKSELYYDWNFPQSVARVIEFSLKFPPSVHQIFSSRSTPVMVAKWGVGMCEIGFVYWMAAHDLEHKRTHMREWCKQLAVLEYKFGFRDKEMLVSVQ